MSISAKIICDSLNPKGVRLTTFIVTYPRFVHAEHLRHRMQSFNVSSSRAIPTSKFRELVEKTPAMPVFWGKNQPGMAAKEELTGIDLANAKNLWQGALELMLDYHRRGEIYGMHKQLLNRLLEPWMPVTVLCTATDWKNFFYLRSDENAQPEIQALSDAMLYQYLRVSTPQQLQEHDWHIPFGDQITATTTFESRLQIAVARCARLSYLTFDGVVDPKKDVELAVSLMKNKHWSPFEHVAEVMDNTDYHGNFKGFLQYRKLFTDTYDVPQFELEDLLQKRQEAGSKYALGHVDSTDL